MRDSSNNVRIPAVACPFFLPVSREEEHGWIHAPRLPLGGSYRGICQADPADPVVPVDHTLCNRGYARGACPRFPAESAGDAVRFSVTSENGGEIRIVYVLEKDGAPVDFGSVDILSGRLESQARAFVDSYKKKPLTALTGGASGPLE
jgi:hypothetical protein